MKNAFGSGYSGGSGSVGFEPRMALFAAMQEMLVHDVPLLPTYESGQVYLQHPQLRGVARAIFGGDPNFRYAYIVEEEVEPVAESAQPVARGRAK